MLQQDLYNQQRHSGKVPTKMKSFNLNYSFLEHMNTTEQMMTTSDTIRDANETLSKSLIFIL